MGLMDLIFTWGDSGIFHKFVNDMFLKIHNEYQRNFENYLDGAIKDPPKLAEIPVHLQHRLQEETATVKQVNEIHRRFSIEGVSSWARPKVGDTHDVEGHIQLLIQLYHSISYPNSLISWLIYLPYLQIYHLHILRS